MKKIQNIETAVLTYTSAWNETDRSAILEKMQACWDPAAAYTDKLTDTITGWEAITDLVVASFQQMGPRTFKVLGLPDTHHRSGRFHWLAIRPEGYPVQGMDYFEFNEENRITRIVGFF